MKRLTTEEFIQKARRVHGDKYNYKNVVYEKTNIPVEIICPIHGSFKQKPNYHLSGNGCPKCGIVKCSKAVSTLTMESFIRRARIEHGDDYDYSNVRLNRVCDKVEIICPIHGPFFQTVNNHLHGMGCPQCARKRMGRRSTGAEFIQKARSVHGSRYDYSQVKYYNGRTEVEIICPLHGSFWQKPEYHLQGNGCPKCNQSRLERVVEQCLQQLGVEYETQKEFGWLKYKAKQRLDFYLPEYKIAIECQGEQHLKPVEIFGGEDGWKLTKARDNHKLAQCARHGIKMAYIYYDDKNIPESIQKIINSI